MLKTGRSKINFLPIGQGIYWHNRFVRILKKHLLLYDGLPDILELELSTDGISLSWNDPIQYWPIQYRVLNIENLKPLIAGIFRGPEKPKDANLFFEAFLEEVEEAKRLGGILVKNRRIPFQFKRFIGDAPARALVLNHKSHNSSRPCSKCNVTGYRYENRVMVYLGIDHKKRTNDEYAALLDEDHHKGNTFLVEMSVPPVTRVPFEIMHLVYLGVAKRLLDGWFVGKFGFAGKLQAILLVELSSRYEKLENWCPEEFARRPKALSEFNRFKATEMRHFVLYASAIILVGILDNKYYYHVLLLYISMRILTSPKLNEERIKVAESALRTLILFAPDLYDPSFVSYNVHALGHLGDDARENGPLEDCSAFIYENNMPLLKKNIRNHPQPLQQIAKRFGETNDIQHKPVKKFENELLSLPHINGPIPTTIENATYKQYKKYESTKFTFTIDGSNNYCKLEDETICKIENILILNSTIFFLIRRFEEIVDFFSTPIKSSSVGVFKCKSLSENLKLVTTNCNSAKCYCMPSYKNAASIQTFDVNFEEYIVSTLLHSDK